MIIAEIGNNHMGSMSKAKDLIIAAHGSGADVIKSQAFVADRMPLGGSMPFSFYKTCQFSLNQYMELIIYARDLGTDLFYSIFDSTLDVLLNFQKYNKISRSQWLYWSEDKIKSFDQANTFISMSDTSKLVPMDKACVFYVNTYMNIDDDLLPIDELRKTYKRVGLSDHSIGPKNCLKAIAQYGVTDIETHFKLEEIKWNGQVFRDSIHGKSSEEFSQIAKELKR